MTDYGWFPLDSSDQWHPVADWNTPSYWANVTTLTVPPTTGTLPGPGDGAYIVAANSIISPPAPYSPPPYPVTINLDEASESVTTLGLGGIALFATQLQPTLNIKSVRLTVSGAILDHFSKTFPYPVGFQNFTGGGTIALSAAGSLDVGTTTDTAITVDFADTTADILLLRGVTSASAGAFSGLVEGFGVGNAIDLTNVPFAGATKNFASGTLTVSIGSTTYATIRMAGTYTTGSFQIRDDGTGHAEVTVCFAAGTRIATGSGETAVEDLREGDAVLTMEAGRTVLRAVKWIGERRLNLASHPRPESAAPIRIKRHALAENQPHRDLVLSPDHCLFMDGKLIPAKLLVNGMSIVQEQDVPVIHYFHVELERHAILFADGIPVESYLDTGNRAFFGNAGLALVLHPEFQVNSGLRSWSDDACAPLTVAEAEVEPIWRGIADRAEALGYTRTEEDVTNDPELVLVADGQTIRASWVDHQRHIFVLPPRSRQVRIVSKAGRPSDLIPWLDDQRLLGVAVDQVMLSAGGERMVIAADNPALRDGWHRSERNHLAQWRWTDGDAGLPLCLDTELGITVELRIRASARRRMARPRSGPVVPAAVAA